MPSPGEVERALIVKLSSFGDILHATPSIRAVRRAFPGAEIVVAVEERWAPVLRRNPNVDRLITASARTAVTPGLIAEIWSKLAPYRPFDFALDLQGTRRSAAWVYLSGARFKAGRGRPRPLWQAASMPDLSQHAVVVCAEACRRAGVEAEDLEPELFRDPADEPAVDEALQAVGAPSSGFILLNPFSRWASKSWPRAGEFLERFNEPVVITGGSEEREAAEALASRRAVSVAGRLSLPELFCLLARARLVISCDSGPMHAAAALGVPVVALFGPTHPERTGPWGTRHRVVQAKRPAEHSAYRNDPGARYLHALEVEPVLRAVEAALVEG